VAHFVAGSARPARATAVTRRRARAHSQPVHPSRSLECTTFVGVISSERTTRTFTVIKALATAALSALLLTGVGPATPGAAATTTAIECPAPTTTVGTMAELQAAVDVAKPGNVIEMLPGTYAGSLVMERSGAKANPIWLCGPRSAVIDAGDVARGRVVHMKDADNWRLVGFT